MPKASSHIKSHTFERQLLQDGAATLGLRLSESQVQAFITYLELLTLWNERVNLTSIRDPRYIIRLHFFDSLAILPSVGSASSMVDIGSGAGFPGIPIQIIYPDKEICLLEARRKRASFLHEIRRKLQLKNLQIYTARAEATDSKITRPFDEAVARATVSLQRFLRLCEPWLRLGGRALFMSGPKGTGIYEEQGIKKQALELGFKPYQLLSYGLPLGDEQRTLLIFTKVG